jgi:heme A synthase
MSLAFWMALVFGTATLAVFTIILIWWKVLFAKDSSRKLMTVAIGLMVANAGVGILTFNRSIAALVGYDIYPLGVVTAGVIILIGKVIWMIGSTIGSPRWPVYLFAGASLAYWCFLLWRFL